MKISWLKQKMMPINFIDLQSVYFENFISETAEEQDYEEAKNFEPNCIDTFNQRRFCIWTTVSMGFNRK